jgi:hypothetical protein
MKWSDVVYGKFVGGRGAVGLLVLRIVAGLGREGPQISDSLLRWLRPLEDRRRSHEETTEIRA